MIIFLSILMVSGRTIRITDPEDPTRILIIERQRRSSTTYNVTETWDNFDVQQYVESRDVENNTVMSRSRLETGRHTRTTEVKPIVSTWHEDRITQRMERSHFIAKGLLIGLVAGGTIWLCVREFTMD